MTGRPSPTRPAPLAAALAALALLALGAAALAQGGRFDPRGIEVRPRPGPGLTVEVRVDRDPSGLRLPTYRVGEPIALTLWVSEDAFVYLFDVAADGTVTQLLPNRFDAAGRDPFVPAGRTVRFPPAGARYDFTVAGPRGVDEVVAIASRVPLDTRALVGAVEAGGFASARLAPGGFAERLGIVVRPVPREGWVEDRVRFRVR